MERTRLDGRLEPRVQLVVERSRPLHRCHVLGDACEIDGAIVRHLERPGEMLGEIASAVETDHRNDATGQQRLHDLTLFIARRGAIGHGETGLVSENFGLEALELGAGLDPELVDEAGASVLVHLEGLGLPASAIEREHQLPPERLAQRVLAGERLQLADDIAVTAEVQVSLDPLPVRDQAKFLEPADLGLREIVECKLRERRPAPEPEGLL